MVKKVSRLFMFGGMYIFWVNGLLVLMTSAILVYLINDYDISYDKGGLLLSVQATGNLLSNLLSGVIANYIGRRKTLLLAAALFAIGFGIVALMPPLMVLYIALFVTGLGWGSANNMINFLVTRATDGDTAKIAAIHTCYSIGAFVAPLLTTLFVNIGLGWRPAVAVIAILSILMIPLILAMPITESTSLGQNRKSINNTTPAKRSYNFLRQWRYYLFMLILFTYVGSEVGFSGWLVSYLTTIRSIPETQAQSLLSTLWVFMIFGRIAAAIFGNKVRKAPLLMIEAIGCTVAAVILVQATSPALLTIAVILMGISLSAFYGMCIANASYLVSESAVASGLMLSFGGLGATLLPYIAGAVANDYGLISGMWTLTAAFAMMAVFTAINAVTARITELREIKKVKTIDILFPR
jgi:fucose permease